MASTAALVRRFDLKQLSSTNTSVTYYKRAQTNSEKCYAATHWHTLDSPRPVKCSAKVHYPSRRLFTKFIHVSSRFAKVIWQIKGLHLQFASKKKYKYTKQCGACTWRLWDSSCATQAAPHTFKGCMDIMTPTFFLRATAKTVTSGTYTLVKGWLSENSPGLTRVQQACSSHVWACNRNGQCNIRRMYIQYIIL